MANVKISELEEAATLTGDELVEIVQGGENVQTTAQAIADLGGGGGGLSVVSPQTGAFTADGPSGTVYTDEGAGSNVEPTLEDSLIGTTYTFLNVDGNGIYIRTPPGNNIVFWEKETSQTRVVDTDDDGSYLQVEATGMSITILKTTTTTWLATAINGATWND